MSNHPLQQDNSVSIDAPLRNGQTMGSLATSNLEGAVNGSTILLQSTITTSQANPRNNFFAAHGNAIGIGWDGISN